MEANDECNGLMIWLILYLMESLLHTVVLLYATNDHLGGFAGMNRLRSWFSTRIFALVFWPLTIFFSLLIIGDEYSTDDFFNGFFKRVRMRHSLGPLEYYRISSGRNVDEAYQVFQLRTQEAIMTALPFREIDNWSQQWQSLK